MERRKEEKISDIIPRLLRQMQLEVPLNEHRACEAWFKVAGSLAARHTESVRFFNQKLFVKLRSAALRSELIMKRTQLCRLVNDAVGSRVIIDIVFQ